VATSFTPTPPDNIVRTHQRVWSEVKQEALTWSDVKVKWGLWSIVLSDTGSGLVGVAPDDITLVAA